MSAQAGWYPDPGGGNGLYRYWDGKAWSAATSPNPSAPPPSLGLVNPVAPPAPTPAGQGGQGYGGQGYGGQGSAYAAYQQTTKRRTPWGWWLAGGALVVVIVVIAVLAVRATTGLGAAASPPGGQGSQNACPQPKEETVEPGQDPNDGRVHGGPLSYPELDSPWALPAPDDRVPFGTDVRVQTVLDQADYDGTGKGHDWVASVLVAELQAGDGFFSPEDGSKIVVKCILGTFYGPAAVTSDVTVNKAATIDGHDAWIVESELHFDIPGLRTKGERLIVAIVATGTRSGLFYASIPDTQPTLLEPARQALAQLTVTE
ncbi:DUF2510 domain-containing protein [uncultured Friedmanniella sp.]|uniref:DUF2510 domain-containing protein n=1 Tax=uncultured Friedmanniella sp. TaxID=335381 RepID=UPI0035CA3D2A